MYQVGVVVADAESVYTDSNPSMCRMLGYTRDELVGLHASDITAAQEAERIAPALDEIRGRSEHRREWHFRRKDRSVFPADVIATRVPDGTLLGMVRDLSDRQRADDYRERLAVIVESSRDAIIGTDLDGVVVSWNAGAEAIFGCPAAAIVGAPIARLIPDEARWQDAIFMDKLRRGECVEPFETLRRTADGRAIDVSVLASPTRDAGGGVRLGRRGDHPEHRVPGLHQVPVPEFGGLNPLAVDVGAAPAAEVGHPHRRRVHLDQEVTP